MKTVILAGGLGTRLSEETVVKPKPMVEIGGRPALWHIMNIYAARGFKEFVVALGHKGEIIKDYFISYHLMCSDLTVSLKTGDVKATGKSCKRDWTVHLTDTGAASMTGGRLHRLRDRLKNETFMLTYGDGVSDIDIKKLVSFHKKHGKTATVTAVRPTARFGGIKLKGGQVTKFKEKPQAGEGWINGGFFVFSPKIFNYLSSDSDVLEGEPMESLCRDGQLMAYEHSGFWQCMDTMRDKQHLESLWQSGSPPWKIWED